jgi:hypoxanthine phosphoribosyltransferase
MNTMMTGPEMQVLLEQAECLYSLSALEKALDRMAQEITALLKNETPIVLCVMTGALIPTGHLLTRLHFPLQIDYIHVTRYQGAVRGGDLHWLVEPRHSLEGRTVLIVDDIMDGGLTLSAIIDYCHQARAKNAYSAVIVDKKRQREPGVNIEPDFKGVETEDKFLVGFGLDYNGFMRNLPGIYALKI